MRDYTGDMDYFQNQLTRAGISRKEFDMGDYVGLTARELQSIVNAVIANKKLREEHAVK